MSWQLASFTLLGLALVGGFAWYERSRPSSRTVAIVATLAAMATLGRIAFTALPSVKPTTDIVLIAGYTLGGAPGFMVGAVSALASNMFFGQGPWTPWQMLAWGLVGLAGAALARGGSRGSRWRRSAPPPASPTASSSTSRPGDLHGHTLAQFLRRGPGVPFDLAHAIGNLLSTSPSAPPSSARSPLPRPQRASSSLAASSSCSARDDLALARTTPPDPRRARLPALAPRTPTAVLGAGA